LFNDSPRLSLQQQPFLHAADQIIESKSPQLKMTRNNKAANKPRPSSKSKGGQTRQDVARIQYALMEPPHRRKLNMGALTFTKGGILMPADVLAGNVSLLTEGPHITDYPKGNVRLSSHVLAQEDNLPSLASSESEDEIIFVGKDPKARIAAMKEPEDSDWSMTHHKREKQTEIITKGEERHTAKESSGQNSASAYRNGYQYNVPVHFETKNKTLSGLRLMPETASSPKQNMETPGAQQTNPQTPLGMPLPIHQSHIHTPLEDRAPDNQDDMNMRDQNAKGDIVTLAASEKNLEPTPDSEEEMMDDGEKEDEDEILRDYIENILNDSKDGTNGLYKFASRQLDLTDEPICMSARAPDTQPSRATRKTNKSAPISKKQEKQAKKSASAFETKFRSAGPNKLQFLDASSSESEDNEDEEEEEDEEEGDMHMVISVESWIDPGPLYEFDVMDFERSSLQNKKRAKKGKMAKIPQISDDELQQKLNNAWENDRIKKRHRKIQREELRKQGLLSRRSNNKDSDDEPSFSESEEDLNMKYPQGLTNQELWAELRELCKSDRTS
jgi:hypothetical protein